MIKTLTAYTQEIDDVQASIDTLINQLDLENSLLQNSVGIIMCHPEFVHSGIIEALYESVRFPLIGSTTTGLTTNTEHGIFMLSITVITSDELNFSTGCTASLSHELNAPIKDAYEKAAASLSEKPKLIISTPPLLLQHAGDQYIEILDEVSGGIPNFGTLSIDDTTIYDTCYTIFNGSVSQDTMSFLLISGNISPRFYTATMSPEKVLKQTALVTKFEGNLLKEVNGLPLIKYLQSLNLATEDKVVEDLTSIPLIIDYKDGSQPVSKVLIALNEDNHGICGGIIPEGTTLSLGVWDKADVISTTLQTVERALENKDANGLLMFSCVGRSMALNFDISAELEAVEQRIGTCLPYMLAYSGGEICPVVDKNGKTHNRFHNNSIIACIF